MRQPTSRPAKSPIANGPIGKPKSVSAPSTSCGSAPSSSRRSASTPRSRNMRLPTKPWHTPTTAGTLPSLRPTAIAVASVSGDVEVGRVGGDDSVRLDDAVEPAEHLLLHAHVLEHGLDHDVGIRNRRKVGGA